MGMKSVIKNTLRNLKDWLEDDNKEYIRSCTIDKGSKLSKRYAQDRCAEQSSDFEDNNRGIAFNLYSATGGKVVSIRKRDDKTDSWNTTLYIIHDGDDIGEELGQIITMNTLSR